MSIVFRDKGGNNMSKYRCYDWNGNLIVSGINDLKEAVRQALKNDCEIYDENGDIIFSQWDGWNSDYPNIKEICFSVADMEMINQAKQFLIDTNRFYDWNAFEAEQFLKWIGKEWLHSDRWSATYDWVNNRKFEGVEMPNNIIECLVEYWETNALHIKVGV